MTVRIYGCGYPSSTIRRIISRDLYTSGGRNSPVPGIVEARIKCDPLKPPLFEQLNEEKKASSGLDPSLRTTSSQKLEEGLGRNGVSSFTPGTCA
jgi:hypothetical protein